MKLLKLLIKALIGLIKRVSVKVRTPKFTLALNLELGFVLGCDCVAVVMGCTNLRNHAHTLIWFSEISSYHCICNAFITLLSTRAITTIWQIIT
jgi:hypothetical protein